MLILRDAHERGNILCRRGPAQHLDLRIARRAVFCIDEEEIQACCSKQDRHLCIKAIFERRPINTLASLEHFLHSILAHIVSFHWLIRPADLVSSLSRPPCRKYAFNESIVAYCLLYVFVIQCRRNDP